MKTTDEIRKDSQHVHLSEEITELPRPPQQPSPTLPRVPGQQLPIISLYGPGGRFLKDVPAEERKEVIVVDEVTGRVARQTITPIRALNPILPPPIDPETFNWGFNRVTGRKITCSCHSDHANRSMHMITCPVWMTRGLVVYYSNDQHLGSVRD